MQPSQAALVEPKAAQPTWQMYLRVFDYVSAGKREPIADIAPMKMGSMLGTSAVFVASQVSCDDSANIVTLLRCSLLRSTKDVPPQDHPKSCTSQFLGRY